MFETTNRRLGLCVALFLSIAICASAMGGVTLVFDPGTTNNTTALTGYQTHGDDMAGMKVTASFLDGSSETAIWAATSGAAGAATGTGWVLSESGDTYGGSWNLNNTRNSGMSKLVIDAGPGNTVFDIDWSGYGTAGSANGWTFSSSTSFNIIATYKDLVALTGNNPVGDLYRFLILDFTDASGMNSSMSYIADTDNIKFAGDINPVPLPAAAWMGLALLGGFGALRLRRRA